MGTAAGVAIMPSAYANAVEVHHSRTHDESIGYEDLGLAAQSEAQMYVETKESEIGGALSVNTVGGCASASGVAVDGFASDEGLACHGG